MKTVDVAERTLPANLDAERAVLGAILTHAGHYATATRTIRAEDFYRDAHGRIFRAIGALRDQQMAVDLLTLTNELDRQGILDECGGPSYVAALGDGGGKSANVEYYARIVREKARLRGVVYAANTALGDAYDSEDAAVDIVERSVKALRSEVRASGDGLISARDAVVEHGKSIVEGTLPSRVTTGLVDVDEIVKGFRSGDLVIVAARPSVGKTAFALGVCDHMARQFGPVPFFSLEMSKESLAPRLLSRWLRRPAALFEEGAASEGDYARFSELMTASDDSAHPLLLNFDAYTMAEIGAWCEKAEEQYGQLAAIGVDYLQLIASVDRRRDAHEDVADVSHDLKRLAKDRKAPVIALSQLSRAPENRRDKRPQMSDLRGSGALEQDCDVALLLFREETYKPDEEDLRGIAEVIVAKHRNGPTGVARVCFMADQSRFDNLAF